MFFCVYLVNEVLGVVSHEYIYYVGWKGLKAGPECKVNDPHENVVCKCEKVTEAEIVTALHRSLPVDSTQAIRKRTRAGMGHCQGIVLL